MRFLIALCFVVAASLPTAPAWAWEPPAPAYAVDRVVNYPFPTRDGTELIGSVYYPADLQTGKRVDAKFPVLVMMTPYGAFDGTSNIKGADHEILSYFASHGYIGFAIDVRGTGRSAGRYDLWDPVQMQDYLEVIDHAATKLEGTNGVLGLTGMSYRGMNQLLVGGLLKPGTPVKAMAPASAAAFAYDRPFFIGGLPWFFAHAYPAIETVSDVPPPDQAMADGGLDAAHLAQVAAGRAETMVGRAEFMSGIASGGSLAHRDAWWLARDPILSAEAITRAGIPVLLTSSPGDAFPVASLRMYTALQNASRGRSVWAPMARGQKADQRYQMVYGNDYFDGFHEFYLDYELQWYDHWLKGVDNGVADGSSTLRVQETGGKNDWVSLPDGRWPATDTSTPFFLAPDGELARKPAAPATDALAWGPNESLTYTSPPLEHGATLAGSVTATIYASSTASEVELAPTLYDVAPDGTATAVPAPDGALAGRLREVDPARSWFDADGRLILPHHPYTSESEAPVPIGEVVRYDIELMPRVWSLEPGHRLQLTLRSHESTIVPTAVQQSNLAGGRYTIHHGGEHASLVTLPLLPHRALPRAADPRKAGLGGEARSEAKPQCRSRRAVTATLRARRGERILRARAKLAGRRIPVRVRRRAATVRANLAGRGKGAVKLVIVARLRSGKIISTTRTYRPCT